MTNQNITNQPCSCRVHFAGRGLARGHNCRKPATVERDGKLYCSTHDPVKVAERQRNREDRWTVKQSILRARHRAQISARSTNDTSRFDTNNSDICKSRE